MKGLRICFWVVWCGNMLFLGGLGRFEVLSSMNQYSTIINAFCIDKKLFHEFQSGLGYEMMRFCG